ncbi:hypothetical protein Q5P01_008064 [Channa striata]|uniref:Dendritic cell-specific transmembrane protein-like domain-containing protein n=1 Tax=Channa striata TaxID=64152 RepID=A0AA88T2P2_CHASR|nr:hypothetical protein Q5P01_008064 [Channa striata]
MKFITQSLFTYLRIPTGSCRQSLKSALLYLWHVYSAPSPAGRDILTQLFMCLTLAIITGGLLHHWLYKTLTYDHEVSIQTTCIYSVAMFLVSFLCHPLRCMLTMILPTVCTKQGRKLLVSLSVMILVLKVIPNIAVNMGAVAHVVKCTAEGLAKTLLNSSEPLNKVKQDLIDEVIKAKRDELSIVTNLRNLNDVMRVDMSAVKSTFVKMFGQIELNFSHARNLLHESLIVVLDHVVYHIVELIVPWLLDFPPTSAGISVNYKIQWFTQALCIFPTGCKQHEQAIFHKDYKWTLSPEQWLCDVTTSAPNPGVTLLLGCLWLLSYSFVFLEVYALRLRRTISASFFPNQEERRMAHVKSKMQDRREKKEQKQIFYLEVYSE